MFRTANVAVTASKMRCPQRHWLIDGNASLSLFF